MAISQRQQKQWIFKVCLLVVIFGTFVDASFLRGIQKSDELVSLDEESGELEFPEEDLKESFDSVSLDEESESEDETSEEDLSEHYDFVTTEQLDTKQEEQGFYEKYLRPLFGPTVQDESEDEEHSDRNLAHYYNYGWRNNYAYNNYYSYGSPYASYGNRYRNEYYTYNNPYNSYGGYNSRGYYMTNQRSYSNNFYTNNNYVASNYLPARGYYYDDDWSFYSF